MFADFLKVLLLVILISRFFVCDKAYGTDALFRQNWKKLERRCEK